MVALNRRPYRKTPKCAEQIAREWAERSTSLRMSRSVNAAIRSWCPACVSGFPDEIEVEAALEPGTRVRPRQQA
jgi:hypothetical protein